MVGFWLLIHSAICFRLMGQFIPFTFRVTIVICLFPDISKESTQNFPPKLPFLSSLLPFKPVVYFDLVPLIPRLMFFPPFLPPPFWFPLWPSPFPRPPLCPSFPPPPLLFPFSLSLWGELEFNTPIGLAFLPSQPYFN